MLTICWAAKGGSGTTVYATARALASPTPTLLVDLAGDVMTVLGLPDPDGPGVHEWLRSDAPAARLGRLEHAVSDRLSVVAPGVVTSGGGGRWFELAAHLRAESRPVIVDAGTGTPSEGLLAAADESLLVTRACYVSVRHAIAAGTVPTGIVLVDEPGRALGAADLEAAIGAPVTGTVLLDPAIARAADAGLLVSRLPSSWRRRLRNAA